MHPHCDHCEVRPAVFTPIRVREEAATTASSETLSVEKLDLIKPGWPYQCLRGTLTWPPRTGRITTLI
jgi:hypothetical protein